MHVTVNTQFIVSSCFSFSLSWLLFHKLLVLRDQAWCHADYLDDEPFYASVFCCRLSFVLLFGPVLLSPLVVSMDLPQYH